jgi:hypothetical protein
MTRHDGALLREAAHQGDEPDEARSTSELRHLSPVLGRPDPTRLGGALREPEEGLWSGTSRSGSAWYSHFFGGDDTATAQALNASSTAKVPMEVREKIDRLASNDVGRRATAAEALGRMEAAAEPATPWLIAAMSDDRETLSVQFGQAPVYLVVGKALSRIGPPGRKQVISMVRSPSTEMSRSHSALAALTAIRDQTSLDVLLETLPYAYSETDPEGHFASHLSAALRCFLPDPRVPEAMLLLGQSAQRLSSEPLDVDNMLNACRWVVKEVPDSVRTLAETQEWWATHESAASLRPAPVGGVCRQ